MIVSFNDIPQQKREVKEDTKGFPTERVSHNYKLKKASDPEMQLIKSIGQLSHGIDVHYYSYGNFNLVRLLMHLIKQTGPVHAFITSYSISQKSIEQLQNRIQKKELLSFRILVDNLVRSLSPKPFQMMCTSFDYRCTSIHAKVALLWNDEWKITVITSQNATDNPKIERGIIYTDPAIFDFDLKTLENAFQRGTT